MMTWDQVKVLSNMKSDSSGKMSWQQLKDLIDRLTPTQLAREVLIFDSEELEFARLSHAFLAEPNSDEESAYLYLSKS